MSIAITIDDLASDIEETRRLLVSAAEKAERETWGPQAITSSQYREMPPEGIMEVALSVARRSLLAELSYSEVAGLNERST